MNKTLRTAFFIYFFIVSDVIALETKISIDSFKVISSSKSAVNVEVSGINKSGMKICIAGAAKSSKGVIESQTYFHSPAEINAKSGQFTTSVLVARPTGTEPKKTDVLFFIAQSCNKNLKDIIASRQFDWPVYWDAVAKAPNKIPEIPFETFQEKIISLEFKSLDDLLEKWNTQEARDADGAWKLSGFTYALEYSCYLGSKNWDKCFERIQYWKTVSPKTAGLAEAKYWSDYAWNVRGGRYATNIDPYAMKLFSNRMKKAELALMEVNSIKKKNPVWYEIYLGIAIDTKRDYKFIKKVFDESVKGHPTYLPIYSVMSSYWVSPWEGRENWKELDNLINTATAFTFETDSDSNYARLYSKLAYNLKYSESIFQSSFVSWSKMKKSYDTIINKYPSPDNLNTYAFLACQANDKNTFLKLWPRLGNYFNPNVWPHNYSPDLCENKFLQNI